MDISGQNEHKAAEQFVTRIGIAIDKARLARLAIQSRDSLGKSEPHEADSRRLLLVNREIELLEAKLKKVRCRAN